MRGSILSNNIELDVYQEVGDSFNYTIQDIRSPEKRQGNYSKTISLPGTHKNNKFFSNIFQIDKIITTTNFKLQFSPDFNPNIKARAKFLIDDVKIFSGYIQLLAVNLIEKNKIEYEIALFGELANIYKNWGETLINEMDWSIYTHNYIKANQIATWGFTADDNAYCYPMIDYGKSDLETWAVNDFRPATFVKAIIDKAFSDAGFTYNSNFFNSALFKRLIIPNSNKELFVTKILRDKLKFIIFQSGNGTPQFNYPLHFTTDTGVLETVDFSDDISNGTKNLAGEWSVSLLKQTAKLTGNYEYNGSVKLNFDVRNVAKTSFNPPDNKIYVKIIALKNGSTPIYDSGEYTVLCDSHNGAPLPLTASNTFYRVYSAADNTKQLLFDHDFSFSKYLLSGDTVSIVLVYYADPNFMVNFGTTIPANNPIRAVSKGGSIYDNIVTGILTEGNDCEIAAYMPTIKIKDLFTDVVNMFNLYVQPDVNNNTLLHIETRDEYYNNTVVDWTQKADYSKVWKMFPMGELDTNNYKYAYKEDSDYLNNQYKNNNEKTYGERVQPVYNDFLTQESKTELGFSNTPIQDNSLNDRIIPAIYNKDKVGVKSSIDANPRIMYFKGATNCKTWVYHTGAGDSSGTQYPLSGHLDNPYAPTLDLCFGAPDETYYNTTTYTSNNLFNIYYSKFIKEITDTNSKIIWIPVYLKPTDLLSLDFRKLYLIGGNYYRLNKIRDYDPFSDATTICEFLKIRANVAFSGGTVPVIPPVVNEDIIEGGQDEVRDIGATSFYNIIEGGENEVRSIGASSFTNLISGGKDSV